MILSILVPPAILLLEYKSKAEMAHIPQSQDDHQMTMEDSEHNFQNMADDIQMVRFTSHFVLPVSLSCFSPLLTLTSFLQDVFKEARASDHVDAKNDMETHVRSRRLPLGRKMHAFYHAPIVKFWSNTVWDSHENTPARSHTHPSLRQINIPFNYLGKCDLG